MHAIRRNDQIKPRPLSTRQQHYPSNPNMSEPYVNNYAPEPEPTLPESELYGPEPYDINFAWPLRPASLQTPRLKLVPFVPRVHAATYWAHVKDDLHTLFRYYPFLFPSLAATLTFIELNMRRNPHMIFFAVLDKTRPAQHGEGEEGVSTNAKASYEGSDAEGEYRPLVGGRTTKVCTHHVA